MNEEEFTAFFAEMHPALLRYGMRRLDVDTASEVALDALRVVWEKRIPAPRSDEERRQLRGLSYAIMNGLISNSHRAARRRFRLAEALASEQRVRPDYEPGLAEHFVDGRVPEALSQLPARDQEILSLLIDGYGVGEIATILGCSPGAISTRLGRARAKLRTLLKQEDADA
ncbi:MAG: sigma-70 family RNA polymerase sigma factor [Propionibacteriaceae bacterium]|nr:sigma-70 family RNA polymerase sigma factor [Propionibacteriaceae bacterium]